MTARPAVEEGGRNVRLDDIKVTRQIDNPLWSVVTAVVLTELPKTLGSSYTIDLSSKIQDAMLRNGNLSLGRISPQSDALVVEGLFDADVEATLSQINF